MFTLSNICLAAVGFCLTNKHCLFAQNVSRWRAEQGGFPGQSYWNKPQMETFIQLSLLTQQKQSLAGNYIFLKSKLGWSGKLFHICNFLCCSALINGLQSLAQSISYILLNKCTLTLFWCSLIGTVSKIKNCPQGRYSTIKYLHYFLIKNRWRRRQHYRSEINYVIDILCFVIDMDWQECIFCGIKTYRANWEVKIFFKL